ncbi:MAG TPA: MFS transporter [Gaiellaceae bacterium]|nr:MFS transporter [Gaiellaceae bacterium]
MSEQRPPDPADLAEEPLAGAERPGIFGFLGRLKLDTRPLRESAAFRRLWIGQTISVIGGELSFVAIPYQVFQLTHSTLAVGLLGFCTLVPLVCVPLVGGTLADAVDRRKLLLQTEVALVLITVLLAVNAALPHPQVWALYVLLTLGTTAFSLGTPALRSLLPRIVAQDQIAAASALEGIYGNLAAAAGPILAGVLISLVGLTMTYLIDVGTFAASLAALWLLPPLPPAEGAPRASVRSMVEGFRYVRSRPILLGIFLVDTNAMIFGMPMALFPAIGESFGGGARIVGLLYAAPYIGALLASLVSGWTSHVRRQGLGVVVAASCWGVSLVLFGFADALWLALVMLALAGAADYVSAILRSVIVLTATPDEMRGRVTGIEFAQVASAPSLGNVEAGAVASATSLRFSVVSGGIASVVGTLLIAAAVPALLRYDSKDPDA